MIYEFRWEDLLTGQVHRVERKIGQGFTRLFRGRFVDFDLPDLAPTENLRILIFDEERARWIGEILLKR